jgi:hypothetical protein
MKQTYILIAFVLASCFLASQTVEDLPDIEISGPSTLRSILEKRALPGNNFMIPDVVDSLGHLIPRLPEDVFKPSLIYNNHYLYLESGMDWNTRACFVSDSLFDTPLLFSSVLDYAFLERKWSSLNAEAGFVYNNPSQVLSAFIKTVNSSSPNISRRQSVNALKLNYDLNNLKLFGNPMQINLRAELQNSIYRYSSMSSEKNVMHYNNSICITGRLTPEVYANLCGYYSYHSPSASVLFGFDQTANEDKGFFLKSFSLYASKRKLTPGMHLSHRFYLDKNNNLLIYQKSGMEVYNNYRFLSEQPWQKQLTDAIITFYPVNAHLMLNNQSIKIASIPVRLSFDLSANYNLDKPVYELDNVIDNQPVAIPVNTIGNSLEVKLVYGSANAGFTQSVALSREWRSADSHMTVGYVPLITLDSGLFCKLGDLSIKTGLKQCYYTKDELGSYLPESLDLGGSLGYNINQDFNLFFRVSNLLNQGKYFFRTVPTAPASVTAGFEYIF